MISKVESLLPSDGPFASQAYLAGDVSGMARGFAAASSSPALNGAFLAPLGFSSLLSIFTGAAASSKGKAMALTAERCQDLTTQRMGEIQRVRGWSEVLCGIAFVPVRISQAVRQIKMVYFKPLVLTGLALVLVLYVLLVIPIAYRVYLHEKIRRQVAEMTPEERLSFYKQQLAPPPEVDLEKLCLGMDSQPLKTVEAPKIDTSLEEKIKAFYRGLPKYLGVNFLETATLNKKVAMAASEYIRQTTERHHEHELRKMKFALAFGPEAMSLIETGGAIKDIDVARKIYIAVLVLGIFAVAIGLGVYGYSMDLGGLAIVQNYGLMVVSGLFFVCDLYGVIMDLKHSDLKKEKYLSLALITAIFAASLLLYLHHGQTTMIGSLMFYTVLGFWALQMIALFGAAMYKKYRE